MADYTITDDTTVTFHDLFRGEEEDGTILVGRQDIGSFISLPVEALDVIDQLNTGKTVSEVKKYMEEKYGEEVEVEEFIEGMIESEMVKSVDGIEIATTTQVQTDLFTRIRGEHVSWLFSQYAWVFYIGCAVLSLGIFVLFPQYIPRPVDYFFHPWYSIAVGFMFFFSWIFVAVHELAHLFAAKTVGIGGSFSLSHRLVFVVAQTNLGNIWTIPRKKRYIVYFAGIAWDAVMVFVCLALILSSDKGFVTLPVLGYKFLKAVIFQKVWGIVWQFGFNMQTDIYYVVCNFFNCKNLKEDAQNLIKNAVSGLSKRIPKVDMSSIPEREMRAVKWYAILYFGGTVVMLITFFFRNILILILSLLKAFQGIAAGYQVSPTNFMDGVVIIALNVFGYGLLTYLILKPRWNRIKEWVNPFK